MSGDSWQFDPNTGEVRNGNLLLPWVREWLIDEIVQHHMDYTQESYTERDMAQRIAHDVKHCLIGLVSDTDYMLLVEARSTLYTNQIDDPGDQPPLPGVSSENVGLDDAEAFAAWVTADCVARRISSADQPS